MPLNRVYVGFNGASLALTQLYYQQLVEDQIRTRLNFLVIFDTTSIDNGAWLASHLHLFVRLRQLILIDIHQVHFESILNVLTCVKDSVRFDVTFTNCVRAMSTYKNVPEGIYHERIFRSLPQLRMCKLHFAVYITSIFDPPPPDDVLLIDSSFFTISSTLDRLQSLSLTSCTFAFLSHLIRRVPQLRVLSFALSRPWLSNKHSLMHDNIMHNPPIDASFVVNLRRLKISWSSSTGDLELPTQLFSRDVFFQLTHFTLRARFLNNEVVRELLSMLSSQCCYSLDLRECREMTPIVWREPIASSIMLNTFRLLKGWKSMELTLRIFKNRSDVRAYTLPRTCRELDMRDYLGTPTVLARDLWSDVLYRPKHCFPCVNKLVINAYSDPKFVELLISSLPSFVRWNQVVHLTVMRQLKKGQLHSILSHTSYLHTLELDEFLNDIAELNEDEQLLSMDLLNNISTCEMLMANGLQKLIFWIPDGVSTIVDIAHMIVERLSRLQIVQVYCRDPMVPQFMYILIHGLPNLTFLNVECGREENKSNEFKLLALLTPNTRPIKIGTQEFDFEGFLYVCL